MTRLQPGFFGSIMGMNGAVFGCACTAFGPNSLPIRLTAAVAFLGLLIGLNVMWFRAIRRIEHSDAR